MQSFRGSVRLLRRHAGNSSKILDYNVTRGPLVNRASVLSKPQHSACNEVGDIKFVDRFIDCLNGSLYQFMPKFSSNSHLESAKAIKTDMLVLSNNANMHLVSLPYGSLKPGLLQQCASLQTLSSRCFTTMNSLTDSVAQDVSASSSGVAPRIKFKRLDKTAKHIMQILDKEAVEEMRKQREIPDIKPGDIIQVKVEVPENKRRVSMLKGIVIARRNAGLNTTFRLRRLVAGVGIESLFLLYSPNIKEIKLLDKKKVRRAKLYYLRDRMNPLKK